MTQLLQRAFEEAGKLAPAAQDALARVLLHDLESEKAWTDALASSNLDELSNLAEEALAEHRLGKTHPLRLDKA